METADGSGPDITVRLGSDFRGFATDLVFGIVIVGQILNFGHRQKSQMAATDGQAQNRLFIQKSIENPSGAGPG